jgi:hypothetical protein
MNSSSCSELLIFFLLKGGAWEGEMEVYLNAKESAQLFDGDIPKKWAQPGG